MNNNEMSKEDIPKELLDELHEFLGDFNIDLWNEYNEDERPLVNEHCKSFKSQIATNESDETHGQCLDPETFEPITKRGTYTASYVVRIEFSEGNPSVEKDTLRKVSKMISFKPSDE